MDEPFELTFENYAVWWAMTWPALLVGITAFFAVAMTGHFTTAPIVSHILFFSLKALLIPQAIRKEYKTFWLGVVRGDEIGRELTTREHALLARLRVLPLATTVLFLAGFSYLTGFGTPFASPVPIAWIIDASMMPITEIPPFKLNLQMKRVPRDLGFRLQGYRRAKTMPHQTAA